MATSAQVLGLLREQLISSYLGLTGLADAFNLASTFPVLCLTGIGGLNGALHSATASTAAQLPQNSPNAGNPQQCAPMPWQPMSVCVDIYAYRAYLTHACQRRWTASSYVHTLGSLSVLYAGEWLRCKSLCRSATHGWG